MSSERRFIPLAEPDLRGNEQAYLCECIRSGWVSSSGSFVTDMEGRLAQLVDTKYAVATSSGTTALQLLLAAIGIKRDDRVIVPDWTFAATINAVIHAGAVPVIVDVHPDHWSLDADLVDVELGETKRSGGAIGAVIVVDPMGLPADVDALIEVCRRHGVPLIEDAAGSLSSLYRGKPTGGLTDAGILSFNGNKLVTGGGGGAIVTNREDWANRARHLSTQARDGDRYAYDEAGFNYRLTNLNAAVVVAQLERMDEMRKMRRAIAAAYNDALAGRDDLKQAPAPNWADWNAWMYVVKTASAAEADRLTAHMHSQGIGARPFWQRLSEQRPYQAYRCRLKGVSERLSGTLVSLPCSSNLNTTEINRVIAALASWRGKPLAW